MNYKYSFNNIFDDIKKRNQVPPIETLKKLGLETGDRMADIGAGLGYFTIPAARVVGEDGRVYFLETSENMIESMEYILREKKIQNIEIIKVDDYNMKIKEDYLDFILLANVITEIEDKEKFIEETSSILKTGGKISLLDKSPDVNNNINLYEKLFNYSNIKIVNKKGFGKEYIGLTGIKLS